MMDLTTTLIGLVIVALCILPFIYFHITHKAKKNKFINDFLGQARQQQAQVSQYDVWSNYCAIGLDPNSKKLFYLKKRGDQEQSAFINLSEVDKCSVVNLKRTLNEDQVIDRLGLAFTFHNAKHAEKTLEFYSKDEYLSLNEELQLVDKWKTIVDAHLENKQRLSMAV